MTIGMRIKNRRLELGLSVDEVAARLDKNRATIYRYESNEIENLPTTVLEPLAEILQTTPAFLMGWEDDSRKENKFENEIKESLLPYSDHIQKYIELDDHGRFVVDTITNIEYKRVTNFDEKAATYDLPLLGKTAAGEPLEYGDPCYEEYVTVKSIPKGAKFTLTVEGDSMEPLIKDGSIVFVKPQPVAENGEIVVVEIDGTVTCKKFYNQNGKVELRSINDKYEPITKFDTIKVIGKVLL